MQRKWSIRTNLMLLVLAATLPLALLLVYALQENYRLALKEAEHAALTTCEMVSADIQRYIFDVEELLQGLSARPLVGALDPNRCDPLLADFRNLHPRFVNLAVTDSEGKIVCSALRPANPGTTPSVAGTDWFTQAKNTNRFVAGSAHTGPVTGRKVAVLAEPLQDAWGGFAGIIGYSLDLQAFDLIPKGVSLPPGMLLTLVDAAGNVISRSDGNKAAIAHPFADRDALELSRQTPAGVGRVGKGDEARLVSYVSISGTGWKVIGVQPAHNVLSQLSLLANQKYLFAFFLILLSAGSAYLVGRRIAEPIDRIAGVADSIAQGSPHRRAEGEGPAEIAAVAERINQMLDVQQRTDAELRAKNAALEQSEQQISAIMNNAPAIIFVKDLSGRYIHVNREFARAQKMEVVEVQGKTDYELFPPEVADAFASLDRQVLETGGAVKREGQVPAHDGMRDYFAVIAPLRRSDGEIYAICGIATDITDKKRAEEEHQLLEKQFQQSQKLESLGVLAGGIAHDFNNILAVIAGHCSLARLQPAEMEQHLIPIEIAVERAAELCRQMLAYAGKAQLVQAQVDFGEVVGEMVQMLRATLGKNVAVKLDVAQDLPCINGDASQLRQIVMNLIINGAEAIGEEQGEISVRLSRITLDPTPQQQKNHLMQQITPGSYVCLEVSDSGCGMDEKTQKRIFEPFFTTKFTGRGLGMSAVLGILSAHGGALQLVSAPGRGTSFKVFLPVPGDAHPEEQSQTVSPATEHWQGSGTILLVEDEAELRVAASGMLAALGFAVIEATNGKEALEQYQKHRSTIDIALMDIGMPVMGGGELIRELKRRAADLPILVSSGFGDGLLSSKLAQLEVAGLVSKPYNLEQLREVLKGVPGLRCRGTG